MEPCLGPKAVAGPRGHAVGLIDGLRHFVVKAVQFIVQGLYAGPFLFGVLPLPVRLQFGLQFRDLGPVQGSQFIDLF